MTSYMLLPAADMLCLVQGFSQAKEKAKSRRLPFIRRKKTTSENERERHNEKLLQPTSLRQCPATFCLQEKQGLKQLSGSAPSMTYSPVDQPAALTPTTCRSRQKKFQRHFNVDPDEILIDYYSCALVADILLQGHLYISKNYFAFYSNVFGYVTKLLIPTVSVINVTKEKTAFILPNAVGVVTADDRHVFSSLLSRDTTYRLMVQVWRTVHAVTTLGAITAPEVEIDTDLTLRDESSPSPSGSETLYEELCQPLIHPNADVSKADPQHDRESHPHTGSAVPVSHSLLSLPRSTLLLLVSTALLLALFLSASVLMFRVSQLQQSLAKQQSRTTSPLYEVQEFLDKNLNNIYKVRQSLEVLSLMMENEKLVKAVEEKTSDSLGEDSGRLVEAETEASYKTEHVVTS